MWQCFSEPNPAGRLVKLSIHGSAAALTYGEFLERLAESPEFRSYFSELLANVPFRAFRWETPPVSRPSLSRVFECVVSERPNLRSAADAATYAEYFRVGPETPVVSFPSRGGDAQLVVPCPRGPLTAYPHLAQFVRAAPDWQRHALWRATAEQMQARLAERPIWLNTAGGGVAWLHIRLDSRPKYYAHVPYTHWP